MSTFDSLIADLTRDVQRVQPKDVLQFSASWFQSRLEEQRARTRDALAHRPSLASNLLPPDLYIDTPIAPQPTRSTASPFTDPFEPRRISLQTPAAQSTFGALNVSGNGLFSSDGMPDPTTTTTFPPPSFRFDSESALVDPYSVLDHITPSQSPAPGDYLHPPGFNLMERRTSVSAEPISVDSDNHQPLPVYPKTEDQLRRIKASTKNNFLFRDLDEEQETGVLNAMRETQVTAGQVVIRQGDVGDYFYVVESGLLHCYIRTPPPPSGRRPWGSDNPPPDLEEHPQFGKLVQKCTPGASFGDLALMYGHPRAASVVAVEPSTLWCLDRITFRTIILNAAHRRRTMYEQFLSTVTLLSSLSPTERSKIADALASQAYEDGEAVVRQGEMGDTFFFVEEGEAEVTKTHQGDDGETREIVVGHLARGDYFGELSLLRLAPRAATVSAVRRPPGSNLAGLKVAGLDAQAFTRLLGPLREIMERNAGTLQCQAFVDVNLIRFVSYRTRGRLRNEATNNILIGHFGTALTSSRCQQSWWHKARHVPSTDSLVGPSAGTAKGQGNLDDPSASSTSSQAASSTDDGSTQSTPPPVVGFIPGLRPVPSTSRSLTDSPASSTVAPSTPSSVAPSATPDTPNVPSSSSSSSPSPSPSSSPSSSPTSSPVTSSHVPSKAPVTHSTARSSAVPPKGVAPVVVITTTSGSTVVMFTTTLPAQATQPTSGTANPSAAAAKPVSFLQNKPAMTAVFSSVGVLVLLAFVALVVLAVRKRRRDRLVLEAIDFSPTAVHLMADAEAFHKDEEKGYGGGSGGTQVRRSGSSSQSYTYSTGGAHATSFAPSPPVPAPALAPREMRQQATANFVSAGGAAHDAYDSYYDTARQQRQQQQQQPWQQQQQQQQEWSLPELPPAVLHPPQFLPTYDTSRAAGLSYWQDDTPGQVSSSIPFAASGDDGGGGTLGRAKSRTREYEYTKALERSLTRPNRPGISGTLGIGRGDDIVGAGDGDDHLGSSRVLKVVNG